ncbi:MAG: zinc ribbon domain-containing protein [Lachnospiraceae bacterium]|nr:zinc ribbon domain-containing protein [Lachnospiraceae bacterium]
MFCFKCGKQIPDDAKFCKYCGNDMSKAKFKPAPKAAEPEIAVPAEPDVSADAAVETESDFDLPESTESDYDLTEPAENEPDFDIPEITEPEPEPAFEPELQSEPEPVFPDSYEKTEILLEPVGSSTDTVNPVPVPIRTDNTPIKNTPINAPVNTNKPGKRKKSKAPLIVILLLIILLSLGVLGALFLFPEKVEGLIATITGEETSDDEEEDVEEEETEDESSDETDESGDADTEETESEEEELPAGPEWAQAYCEQIEALDQNAWTSFSMVDVNNDSIPEIIGSKSGDENGRILYTYDQSAGVSFVETKADFLSYNSSGAVGIAYSEASGSYDTVYEIKSGKFEKTFEGSCRPSGGQLFDSMYNPNLTYMSDGAAVNYSAYYTNIETLYYNKGITIETTLKHAGYADIVNALKSDDPVKEFESKAAAAAGPSEWKYDFAEEIQYFEAPYTGKYKISLYGANGGGDGDHDYDEEAGVVIGTMTLNAGDKLIVLTGGAGKANKDYWDFATSTGCTVPGGFNGGGECFASGSGGGCTDIYYRGNRVAAAAGSGGGNYGVDGMAGRDSSGRKNIANGKAGGGNATLDAGSGGAGWFGGAMGKADQAGYGGVNGWDATLFTLEQEFGGRAYTMSGSRDGSAQIQYIGN